MDSSMTPWIQNMFLVRFLVCGVKKFMNPVNGNGHENNGEAFRAPSYTGSGESGKLLAPMLGSCALVRQHWQETVIRNKLATKILTSKELKFPIKKKTPEKF
ncbi:hypothetical protein RF11_05175 [Thelohanellus kitauei]|uniref:Uncharacterized protein n=1 Tax=Thelohanellus kitauei TaxID=669202 RepID=A0A0C2IXP0_THEKT|nr:hypothetical protein RF11_05175 [Thelohanellus kitauei]